MESIKYSFLPSILTRQAEAEEAMLAEFEAGNYTIEEPLVKYNPYLINPLAAVVLFKTEQDMGLCPGESMTYIPLRLHVRNL